jgi:rhodanese-related sulfurtransferase
MSEIARLNPVDAWERMQSCPGAVLIDVRDPVEFAFVGHPSGAVNIPWKTAPDWRPNPDFLGQVKGFAPESDRPLFLLCRSGQRSLDAARALAAAGYRNLTNVEEGFEGALDADRHRGALGGWRYHGLPWEQS